MAALAVKILASAERARKNRGDPMALPDKRAFRVGPAWALALACVLPWGAVAQAEDGTNPPPVEKQVIAGKVVDTAGKPIAGAQVVFVAKWGTEKSAEAQADERGRFELKFPKVWVDGERHFSPMVVWAHAPGHNLGKAPANKAMDDKQKEEITITLDPETSIQVRIQQPGGEPLTEGEVTPLIYSDRHQVHPLTGHVPALFYKELGGRVDAKGMATLRGVDAEKVIGIRVATVKHGIQNFRVPEGPKQSLKPFRLDKTGKLEGLIVGARPEWVSQIPVAVVSEERPGGELRTLMTLKTDKDGRFSALAVAAGELQIIPLMDAGVPALAVLDKKWVLEEGRTLRAEVPLMEGVLVSGRVVVKGKGKPVGDAFVYMGGRVGLPAWAKTDKEGRFEVRVLPGSFHPQLYNLPENLIAATSDTPRVVEVPSGKKTLEIPPIEVVEAREIQGTVVGEKGEPLAGVEVVAKSPAFQGRAEKTDAIGAFKLRVPAGIEMKLAVFNEDYETVEVKTLSKNPLKIQYIADRTADKFEAERAKKADVNLTGKVLLEGKPLEGVTLYFSRGVPRSGDQTRRNRPANAPELPPRMYPQGEAKTDAEGRYRLTGLKVGDWYSIRVVGPKLTADMRWNYNYGVKLKESDTGEVVLPNVRLIHWNQTLAGMVVDPQGKPVVGASVSTQTRDSNMSIPNMLYDRDTPPWTMTGADGRFVLKNLPNEPLTIFAYMPSKKGDTSIRFPVKVPAEKNQQNIKVVLDPSLLEDE